MPRPSRSWLPLAPCTFFACALFLAQTFNAHALEARDEPLPVADQAVTVAQEEPAGESVGEPAEDAPVEGEPGPGDAVNVPPDEPEDGRDDDDPANEAEGDDADKE